MEVKTVTLCKDDATIIVNESNLKSFEKLGYSVKAAEEKVPENPTPPDDNKSGDNKPDDNDTDTGKGKGKTKQTGAV
jgi:hypothetical protein